MEQDSLILAPGAEIIPCGNKGWLFSQSGESWEMTAPILDFLASFGHSSPLEERLSEWTARRPLTSPQSGVLRAAARSAVAHGILWDARSLSSHWHQNARAHPTGPVPLVFVPTCNRPLSCSRTAATLLENFKEYGRTARLVVVDTSSDPAIRSEYRSLLCDAAKINGWPVEYVGRDEIGYFSDALARESGAEPRDVSALLTDSLAPGEGIAFGAARNLTLLLDPDGTHASVDDDIDCLGADTRESDAWHFETQRNRSHLSFHPSWEKLLQGKTLRRPDFLGLSSPLLGAHPGLLGDGLPSRPFTFSATQGRLDGMRQSDARIRWVYPGTWGDCGHSTNTVYFHARNRQIMEYLRTAAGFELAMRTRLYRLDFPTTVVGRGFYSAGRSYWLDHRGATPPHLPILRGEDYIQSRFMAAIDPGCMTAYLPFALLHRPEPERPPFPIFRENPQNHEATHGFSQYLLHWMDLAITAWADSTPDEKLSGVGKRFQEYGTLSPSSFMELAVHTGRQLIESNLNILEDLLGSHGGMAPSVEEEWRWLVQQQKKKLFQVDLLAPPDITARHPENPWESTRELMATYGRLIAVWPALRSASPRLARDPGRQFLLANSPRPS